MDKEIKIITTGVDRLVQLVTRKKRISVVDAAKALSMPKVLVEELADFLEEKEAIGMEYKFGVAYLINKEMTSKETKERAKTFYGRREGFVRKVDSVLQYLEQESEGLPKIKEAFRQLTKEIDATVGRAKGELNLLAKYDEMKNAIDTQILEQEKTFADRRIKIEQKIASNKRTVNRYLQLIDENRKELGKEEIISKLLRNKEKALARKLLSIAEQAKDYEGKIKQDQTLIDETVNRIVGLKDLLDKYRKEIEEQKLSLMPLVEESRKHYKKIHELKESFLSKASALDTKTQFLDSDELKNAGNKFNKLFARKASAEKLINKLDMDVTTLKKELRDLSGEAMIIELKSKSKKSAYYIEEFEEKFAKLVKKKDAYRNQVGRLLQVLKKI